MGFKDLFKVQKYKLVIEQLIQENEKLTTDKNESKLIIKNYENTIEDLSKANTKLSKDIILQNNVIEENKSTIEQLIKNQNVIEFEIEEYKTKVSENQDIIKVLNQSLNNADFKIKLLTKQIKEINKFWEFPHTIEKFYKEFPDTIEHFYKTPDQVNKIEKHEIYEIADIKDLVINQLKEYIIYNIPDTIHVAYDEKGAHEYVKTIISNIPKKTSLGRMNADELIFSNHYDTLWNKIVSENTVEPSYKFSETLFCTIDNYLNIKLFCNNRFLSSKELFKLDCCILYRNTKILKEHYDEFLELVNEELKDFYDKNGCNLIDIYLKNG